MIKDQPIQILYVDDDEELLDQTKELLEQETVSLRDRRMSMEVTTSSNFNDALDLLQERRFDLLILDVHLGPYEIKNEEEAGVKVYDNIKEKCFVPIIFYTGLPERVQSPKSYLVHVVEKTKSTEGLLEAFEKILETHIPEINRTLISVFEDVKREYLWEFVENHWQDFDTLPNYSDLGYLLFRRVVASLSNQSIENTFKYVQDEEENADTVHPLRYYIMPPISSLPLAGDVYLEEIEEQKKYFIILTPSCDLYEGDGRIHNAEYVLLAECLLLEEINVYQEWNKVRSNPGSRTMTNFLNIVKNKKDRHYYLPKAISMPNLVIDFQRLKTISYPDLKNLKRVASLDSPYAEAVLTKFARYFGRIGTPDLDLSTVFPEVK